MSILDFMGKLSSFDPDELIAKGTQITEAFAQIAALQQQILANQVSIMAHLGMQVPMPDAAQMALIDAGSQEFLSRIGASGETATEAPVRVPGPHESTTFVGVPRP